MKTKLFKTKKYTAMRKYLYILFALCMLLSEGAYAQGLGRTIQKRWENGGQTLKGDFIQIENFRKNAFASIYAQIDAGPGVGNKPTSN